MKITAAGADSHANGEAACFKFSSRRNLNYTFFRKYRETALDFVNFENRRFEQDGWIFAEEN